MSPVPNSKWNNPETNIILKLKEEISELGDIENLFSLIDEDAKIYKYEFKILNNNLILIKPNKAFSVNKEIVVKLNKQIKLSKSNLIPFQFKFHVSEKDLAANSSVSNVKYNYHKNTTENFPSITVSTNDNPAPGKIFFYNVSSMASNNDRYLAIINNDGEPEYKRQENDIGLGFTLQPSGYISFWNDGNFVLMDSSYTIIDTIGCGNGYTADFHEFIHLPNGHAFLLSWDTQKIDMSKIVANGKTDADVEGLIIQEIDEARNVVFQWRSWDHFEITDAEDIDFTAPYVSYVHGNGLSIADDGNILLSSRVMNEITKIDRITGEIIWRLGGKNNQFAFINDPEKFCRQHHVQQINNGNITLYDNGSCHEPKISKAKEYKIDFTSKTVELVWEYAHPKKMYCSTMGSVQRLDNGNTFINWGLIDNAEYPNITEVRPDKTIAYELYFDTFFHLLYRSFRFVWENNFTTDISDNTIAVNSQNIKLYPNPVIDVLYIELKSGYVNSELEIYNIHGTLVYKLGISSKIKNNTIAIDVGDLKDGVYLLNIKKPGSLPVVERFIKI